MISALTGLVKHVGDGVVALEVGPMLVDVLAPAADLPRLEGLIGQSVTLHTLLYIEGDPNRGSLEPRLIGFASRSDRKFFDLFTTVKGIGPKTALRALSVPVGVIAAAIEARDTRALVKLDGIGKRTAELIVAELAGKAAKFTDGQTVISATSTGSSLRLSTDEEDAVLALVAMGERRSEAELLLDRVRRSDPEMKTTDQLLGVMLRLRG